MVNLELVGMAIAQAISQSKKFAAAEHASAMSFIVRESDPLGLADNLCRIGNLSAIRQELEKNGLISKADVTPSALIINVKTALEHIAKIAKT